jgi:hypothetical protein
MKSLPVRTKQLPGNSEVIDAEILDHSGTNWDKLGHQGTRKDTMGQEAPKVYYLSSSGLLEAVIGLVIVILLFCGSFTYLWAVVNHSPGQTNVQQER